MKNEVYSNHFQDHFWFEHPDTSDATLIYTINYLKQLITLQKIITI